MLLVGDMQSGTSGMTAVTFNGSVEWEHLCEFKGKENHSMYVLFEYDATLYIFDLTNKSYFGGKH